MGEIIDLAKAREARDAKRAAVRKAAVEEHKQNTIHQNRPMYMCPTCFSDEVTAYVDGKIECAQCGDMLNEIIIAPTNIKENYEEFVAQLNHLQENCHAEIMEELSKLSLIASGGGARWVEGIEITAIFLLKMSERVDPQERYKFKATINGLYVPWKTLDSLSYFSNRADVWPETTLREGAPERPVSYWSIGEALHLANYNPQFYDKQFVYFGPKNESEEVVIDEH